MKRRAIIVGATATVFAGTAQSQTQAFIGAWQDRVANLGDINLTIADVKGDGEVEGKIEFPTQGYTTVFGAKPDGSRVARADIKGDEMTIVFASGARYDLKLNGQRLVGHYTRGSSLKLGINFKKR